MRPSHESVSVQCGDGSIRWIRNIITYYHINEFSQDGVRLLRAMLHIQGHFYWHQNVVWKEDLPPNSLVASRPGKASERRLFYFALYNSPCTSERSLLNDV